MLSEVPLTHKQHSLLCNIPSSVVIPGPHSGRVPTAFVIASHLLENTRPFPNSDSDRLHCVEHFRDTKTCDYLGTLVNRRNHNNMIVGGARKDERLWWVEEQEQGLEEKEEGEIETFLRSLLLSLVGVYVGGNELQCGRAADWLESDGCLCCPERLLLQPLLLSPSKTDKHPLLLPAHTIPDAGICRNDELLTHSFTLLFLNISVLM